MITLINYTTRRYSKSNIIFHYHRQTLDKGLSNTTVEILNKLFDLQDTYHNIYNESLNKNTQLKLLFVKYNEKLRHFNKKLKKVKENLESVNVRTGLTNVNREENETFKDIIRSVENEIHFDRNIMKIKYNENDLRKFEKEKQDRISKYRL